MYFAVPMNFPTLSTGTYEFARDGCFKIRVSRGRPLMKKRSILLFVALLLGFLWPLSVFAQSWYNAAWLYRDAVTISNAGSSALTSYQVQITLNSSFNFAQAKSDGSDLLVTAADGVTVIPSWTETWNPSSQQASIWVKVPTIPVGGTTVYLYYGNPSASGGVPVAVPPTGPFTKASGNPIVPLGDPGGGQNLLAENIVYDSATGKYWMVFAALGRGIGLAWSNTPADPTSWNWGGIVYNIGLGTATSWASCLVHYNGTWYIFFADFTKSPITISAITATSVTGPYGSPTVVLQAAPGTWENCRLDEPYVFQRSDGKWIMMYMGDSTGGGGSGACNSSPTEQVGYASADTILGPYTKYAGNPVIPFGSAGKRNNRIPGVFRVRPEDGVCRGIAHLLRWGGVARAAPSPAR